jgi:hypothetical protein
MSLNTAGQDRVVSFRLEGSSGSKVERIQGAILVSRLLDIIRKIPGDKTKGPAAVALHSQRKSGSAELPPPKHLKSVRVVWEDWSSAVSLHESWNTTAPEVQNTRILNLARSRIDGTRAVLSIRDFNQRMLLAPSGHLTRNIGYSADQIQGKSAPVADTFRLVTDPKILKSVLFARPVHYGLGHRVRHIDLGVYRPNTASSSTFWSDNRLLIDPGVSQTVMVNC